jgi:hypothetical protein
MRSHQLIFLFCTLLSIISCTEKDISITASFDRGSIGDISEISPGYLKGTTRHWLKRDSIGDQYYWFYFKANNVKDRNITFELGNLAGVYRGNPHLIYSDYTQPVFSYDQQTWSRITDVAYDSSAQTLTFSQHFKSEPVWIAYAHPYSYSHYQSFLSSIDQSDHVSIEIIAKTKEDREINLITITNTESLIENKKTILLMAMQHAGEDAGGYFMEGLVNFLLSENAEAVEARNNFVYKLVPMMNPDGIFNGTSRYNMAMEDLNNIWLSSEKSQPEVEGVQRWTENWKAEGQQIDMFWDVHNHTQFYRYNVLIFKDNTLDSLQTVMDQFWPVRLWHSEPVGSSHAYFLQMGVPSGSLELTQSFAETGDYLTIEDYHKYGKATVLGFNKYFGVTSN